MARSISILGSTGSIGRSTLDVISRYPDQLEVVGLAAGGNAALLAEQVERFRPQLAALNDESGLELLRELCARLGTALLCGEEGLAEVAALDSADLVVSAVVGAAGLAPTLTAVTMGKTVALANKEALVMGGELIMETAAHTGAAILPLDSEHGAIFQCLSGRPMEQVGRLILTASGGPFRGWSARRLAAVTPEMALDHPTWKMGPKITIDSATLMNKGLEVIEACLLFAVPDQQVDVLVHPQSIVHSMIELRDGSLLAQLGPPDMRVPIRHALAYPEVWPPPFAPFDLSSCSALTFEPLDETTFPSIVLARQALRAGGTAPAVLSVANESAVSAFLEKRISFPAIWELVTAVLDDHQPVAADSLAAIESASCRARQAAAQWLRARGNVRGMAEDPR